MTDDDAIALASTLTCLCHIRLGVLHTHLLDTKYFTGEIWECGTYRGGSALYMAARLRQMGSTRCMRVFDTFAGMPASGTLDTHKVGSFADVDYGEVLKNLSSFNNISVYRGIMPATFAGLEDSVISLAHIDTDQYESTAACLVFVYPRMQEGGCVVMDDYNCPGCRGARMAIDEFMTDKAEASSIIEVKNTPQAYFIKR